MTSNTIFIQLLMISNPYYAKCEPTFDQKDNQLLIQPRGALAEYYLHCKFHISALHYDE